ncbi:MAG: amidohydrolase family protein [Gemmatimonadota bacterium]|nr:amidohydrolase family protein [Gemmatimonadota bacterium]
MCRFRKTIEALAVILLLPILAHAAGGDLKLLDWEPRSQLVVKQTRVLQPKFPVIEMHNHLGLWGGLDSTRKYLAEMDKAGVWKCVSLDGFHKSEFFKAYGMSKDEDHFYKKHLRISRSVSKERFLVFYVPYYSGIDEPDFGTREVKRLEEAVKMGVRGLKIHKILGLFLRDKSGRFVPVDDPRFDPLWAKCGELGIPVMIHVSDPKAFFTPVDKYNERYDELGAHPDWAFDGEEFFSKEELLAQRNRVFAKHPETVFIGAHVGTLPEELHQVGMWLDTYPNFYIDISARIAELGRQPYTARKFMIRYQDRILFGTDSPPNAELYRTYFRFLETDDEYFDYSAGLSNQGRWRIYGLHLPDQVLEKIYNKNALRIIGMFKGLSKK